MKCGRRRARASDWMPGLFHEEMILRDVLDTLPGIPPDRIPAIIRFFENPKSSWSLPGAIDLYNHDCIHVLLGRGLRSEDEAFVIGFTMGQSDGVQNKMTTMLAFLSLAWLPIGNPDRRLRDKQIALFKFVSSRLYPKAARFSASDLKVYELGLAYGESARVRNLERWPFRAYDHCQIGGLRDELGIDVMKIEALYRYEKILAPGPTSDRLDTNPSGVDHIHIDEPI